MMSINRTITFLISEDVSASLDIDSVEIKRLRAVAEGEEHPYFYHQRPPKEKWSIFDFVIKIKPNIDFTSKASCTHSVHYEQSPALFQK